MPVAKGDILAITTTDKDGTPYVVASFHGDTNGLATKPVLDAIVKAMSSDPALVAHKLIFGLDANTYEKATPGKTQDVLDFGKRYVLTSLLRAGVTFPRRTTTPPSMPEHTFNLSLTRLVRVVRRGQRAMSTRRISSFSRRTPSRLSARGRTIPERRSTLRTWRSLLSTSPATTAFWRLFWYQNRNT